MATFYLLSNSSFGASHVVEHGERKPFRGSGTRTASGTITQAKVRFTCTGDAKVSFALFNGDDGVNRLALKGEQTYAAGTYDIILGAESGSNASFSEGDYTTVVVNNGSSRANITVKGIEITYTPSSGGGGTGGDSGSGSTGSEVYTLNATFSPSSGTLTYGSTVTVNYDVTITNRNSNYDYYICATGGSFKKINSNSASGTFTLTFNNPGEEKIKTWIQKVNAGSLFWGGNLNSAEFTGPEATYNIQPGVPQLPNKNLSISPNLLIAGIPTNVNFSWGTVVENGNTLNNYYLYENDIIIEGKKATSTSKTITLEEGTVNRYKVKASIGNYELYSNENYLHSFSVTKNPEITNFAATDSTLLGGEATLTWSAAEFSHSASSSFATFTTKYQIEYQTSSDLNSWSDAVLINDSDISETEYTITNIDTYISINEFIRFIIKANFYRDGNLFHSVESEPSAARFAGAKPNQLTALEFVSQDWLNISYQAKLSSVGGEWEKTLTFPPTAQKFEHITKNTTLNVTYESALPSGYSKNGVNIEWKKNNIVKSKIFDHESINTVSFDDVFFDDDFWSDGNLELKITAAGYNSSAGTWVLEEDVGYFYKGTSIQTIKKPQMVSTNAIFNPANNGVIPVSNIDGYKEPQSGKHHIYDLDYSHPQNVARYGCKIVKVTDSGEESLGDVFTNDASASKEGFYRFNNGIKPRINLDLFNSSGATTNLFTALFGSEFPTGGKFKTTYKIYTCDIFGTVSDPYEYQVTYDCDPIARLPEEPKFSTIDGGFSSVNINPYGEDNERVVFPLMSGSRVNVKFYAAYSPYHSETAAYTNGYLDFSTSSNADPCNYYLYKFILKGNNEFDRVLVKSISKGDLGKENDGGKLKYSYNLSPTLQNSYQDEIAYYQIVPYYERSAANGGTRILNVDSNVSDTNYKSNIYDGSTSRPIWTYRSVSPEIDVLAVERIGITEDNEGKIEPKIKLGVIDWGTTNQFYGANKLSASNLSDYTQNIVEVIYDFKFFEEQQDGSFNLDSPLANPEGYVSEHVYQQSNLPTTGTNLFYELPSIISDFNNRAKNYKAVLTVTNEIKQTKIKDGTSDEIELIDVQQIFTLDIPIFQNSKTFLITKGQIGVNQPNIKQTEESLYIVDKGSVNSISVQNYRGIIGLEISDKNKIGSGENVKSAGFVEIYDNPVDNGGDRVSLGGFGMVKEDNAAWPCVIWKTNDGEASLKLIPETPVNSGLTISGNSIDHTDKIAATTDAALMKVAYNATGHITTAAAASMSDVRTAAKISYGTSEPVGTSGTEGEIYLWVQSE